MFSAGKIDEAFKELQNAAKLNPKLAPPRVQLASLLFQAKEGRAARQSLEAAAAEDPKHPDVYLMNASFAFGEGRLTDAILSCQIVLQLAVDPRWDPEQRKRFTREARLGLATSFEGRRDFASARDQLAAILAEEPKNGIARTRLAVSVFMQGKPDEAFTEFSTAYRDDPALELPELQIAGLYSNQGDNPKAEEWFKKAVAVHGANVKSHRAYAGWLLDNGKLDESQLYIESAGKLDAAGKETKALRGLALRYRKDFANAELIFEELLKESPSNSFAALNLALTLAESPDKKKITKAVELAENEARKNGKNPEALAILGWCYYKNGQMDNAEKALVGSYQTASQAGQGLTRDSAYFLARLLYDKSKYDEVQKLLKTIGEAKGAHVYRAEAAALLVETDKKVPPPKK